MTDNRSAPTEPSEQATGDLASTLAHELAEMILNDWRDRGLRGIETRIRNHLRAALREPAAPAGVPVARIRVKGGCMDAVEKIGPTPPDGTYLLMPEGR